MLSNIRNMFGPCVLSIQVIPWQWINNLALVYSSIRLSGEGVVNCGFMKNLYPVKIKSQTKMANTCAIWWPDGELCIP